MSWDTASFVLLSAWQLSCLFSSQSTDGSSLGHCLSTGLHVSQCVYVSAWNKAASHFGLEMRVHFTSLSKTSPTQKHRSLTMKKKNWHRFNIIIILSAFPSSLQCWGLDPGPPCTPGGPFSWGSLLPSTVWPEQGGQTQEHAAEGRGCLSCSLECLCGINKR